jgi:hypothetical protein
VSVKRRGLAAGEGKGEGPGGKEGEVFWAAANIKNEEMRSLSISILYISFIV